MDKKFLRLVIVFFLLVALLAGGVAIWQLNVARHGGFEFRMHRENYVNLVEAVDSNTKGESGYMAFYASDLADAGSIRRMNPKDLALERGKGAGSIWVMRNAGPDSLVVWIETLDLGHAGEYGYVFARSGKQPGWDADALGERWEVMGEVDAHWWKIRFNLD